MAARINLTDEHYEWVASQIIQNPSQLKTDLGYRFRQRYPDLFPETTSSDNIVDTIRKKARAAKFHLPQLHLGPVPGGRQSLIAPEAHAQWKEENPELVLPYIEEFAVIGDLHFPLHNEAYINWMLERIQKLGIKTVMGIGDWWDNAHVGHKGRIDHHAPPYAQGVYAGREFVKQLHMAGVTTLYMCRGNHDEKPTRGTQQEIPFADWAFSILRPRLEDSSLDPCSVPASMDITITNRFYYLMRPKSPEPWTHEKEHGWTWDNFPIRFTHQANYSTNELTVAGKLAYKHFSNVFCGHQHHLGAKKHGPFWAVDCGCGQDHTITRYKNDRDSTHKSWSLGFAWWLDGTAYVEAFHT